MAYNSNFPLRRSQASMGCFHGEGRLILGGGKDGKLLAPRVPPLFLPTVLDETLQHRVRSPAQNPASFREETVGNN